MEETHQERTGIKVTFRWRSSRHTQGPFYQLHTGEGHPGTHRVLPTSYIQVKVIQAHTDIRGPSYQFENWDKIWKSNSYIKSKA